VQFWSLSYSSVADKPLGEDTTLATGSGKDWIELIKIPDGRAAGIASKAAPASAAPSKTNKNVAAKSETVAEDSKNIMVR
jgi:hypothetical protein